MGKLQELDAVRALAATWVFAHHVLFFIGLDYGNGALAVTLFIMISGFAIASSRLKRQTSYREYMARRTFRIYPIYLVALALGVVSFPLYVDVLQALPFTRPHELAARIAREAAVNQNYWKHILAHVTLLHGVFPENVLPESGLALVGPAWSLSLEWQFYLVAPLVIGLVTARDNTVRLLGTFGLVFLALLSRKVLGRFYTDMPSLVLLELGYFLIGIFTAIYLPIMAKRPDWVIAMTALVVVGVSLGGNLRAALPVVCWCGVILAATVKGFRPLDLVGSILRLPFLVRSGEASYGFYILHMPILLLWARAMQLLWPTKSPLLFAAELWAVFPIIWAIAYASYYWFEKPVLAWGSRKFRDREPRPAAVAEAA